MSRSSTSCALSIGELAVRSGASPRSLRHYEAGGLLHPTRASNGYRCYRTSDVTTVHGIKHMLQLGLRLSEIAPILPCIANRAPQPACPELVATLRAQRARLDDEIAAATRARAVIDDAIEQLTFPATIDR